VSCAAVSVGGPQEALPWLLLTGDASEVRLLGEFVTSHFGL
jgi:hypothetical protein